MESKKSLLESTSRKDAKIAKTERKDINKLRVLASWRDIITTRFTILIVLLALGACTNTRAQSQAQGVSRQTPSVSERHTAAASFDDAIGRDWALAQLRSEAGNVIIDREKLAAQGFGGAFTLRFDAERISGAGAPNRYTAPYTLGEDQSICIGLIAGTLMAAIFEPEELTERDYFSLLQNVSRWNLADGSLELYAGGTVLVFSAE